MIAVGEDEDDCVELMGVAIDDAYAQFPGSTFGATETEGPKDMFWEMNKHILTRALWPTIGSVLAQPMINAGNFLLVSYLPGARAEFDLDPAYFSQFLKDVSPRKKWWHVGK